MASINTVPSTGSRPQEGRFSVSALAWLAVLAGVGLTAFQVHKNFQTPAKVRSVGKQSFSAEEEKEFLELARQEAYAMLENHEADPAKNPRFAALAQAALFVGQFEKANEFADGYEQDQLRFRSSTEDPRLKKAIAQQGMGKKREAEALLHELARQNDAGISRAAAYHLCAVLEQEGRSQQMLDIYRKYLAPDYVRQRALFEQEYAIIRGQLADNRKSPGSLMSWQKYYMDERIIRGVDSRVKELEAEKSTLSAQR